MSSFWYYPNIYNRFYYLIKKFNHLIYKVYLITFGALVLKLFLKLFFFRIIVVVTCDELLAELRLTLR